MNPDDPWQLGEHVFNREAMLHLTAFNMLTKQNGFYQKKLNQNEDPELLSMSPLHVYTQSDQVEGLDCAAQMFPVKAKDVDKWIVIPHSSNEAPNFHVTTDFKKYKQLTDLHPHRSYNWLTTELINWKQLDGTSNQGSYTSQRILIQVQNIP